MTLWMEISVLIDEAYKDELDADWLEGVAGCVLAAQDAFDAEIELMITGQERMRLLNRQYRGKDKPTDVLAFPAAAPESGFQDSPEAAKHLGEVVISYPQAVIQATEQEHSVRKEVATLIIHGVLHLLGFDHINDDDEAVIKERETAVMCILEEC
jgi:probable rRNA maturation factor